MKLNGCKFAKVNAWARARAYGNRIGYLHKPCGPIVWHPNPIVWHRLLVALAHLKGNAELRFRIGQPTDSKANYSQTEVVWEISSLHIIRICLGVLRTLGFYINFRQSAINDHPCCVLAHASPLSVLKHALGRKCSLMATPSKRDSVNAQSSFKIRSVDSQTISFWL